MENKGVQNSGKGMHKMHKKMVGMVILFSLLFGTVTLEARTHRKHHTYRKSRHYKKKHPNPLEMLNKLIRGEDDDLSSTQHKKRRYRRHTYRHRKPRHHKKPSKEKKTTGDKTEKLAVAAAAAAASTLSASSSEEEKLQQVLSSLGYYHGLIDGDLNSFETRNAIKTLNRTAGNGSKILLDPQSRATLLYLWDLFRFDQNLKKRGDDEKIRGIRIQTALKVTGFYHDNIDGLTGSVTRSGIRAYRESRGLGEGETLNESEEKRLVQEAILSNQRNIEEARAELHIVHNGQTDRDQKTMVGRQAGGNSGAAIPIGEKIKKSSSDMDFSDLIE